MAIEPISQFYSKLGRYPGNNKQWWVARAPADDPGTGVKSGDFLPEILDKQFSGNNRAPRGHFIINAFYKDRSAVSGIADINPEIEATRPVSCTFFSGRAWFAAGSNVYYSQILDHKSKAGLCYQEADPTAEDISDLIDSDGGVVPLPEANKINKLLPFSNGVVVFALNGVWFISGGDKAFSATNVSVTKISTYGSAYPKAIVAIGDTIFWWSEIGIHALEQASGQFGPIPGKFGNTNIAEQTIQSYYNNIPEKSRQFAKGVYDPKNNVIQWLFNSTENNQNRYDSILNFDVTLQAFYPWSISDFPNGPEVAGVFVDIGALTQLFDEDVVDSFGVTVVNSALEDVIVQDVETSVENKPTNLTYTTVSVDKMTFSKFYNDSYVDWESENGEGVEYTSFMETGFDLENDIMRNKQAVYLFVHLRDTETPSSCKVRTKWDWSNNSNGNRWSREFEAFRKPLFRVTSTVNEEAFPVIVTKNKVRGHGKAIQLRFECNERNKNFDLLGWAVAFAGNTEP